MRWCRSMVKSCVQPSWVTMSWLLLREAACLVTKAGVFKPAPSGMSRSALAGETFKPGCWEVVVQEHCPADGRDGCHLSPVTTRLPISSVLDRKKSFMQLSRDGASYIFAVSSAFYARKDGVQEL